MSKSGRKAVSGMLLATPMLPMRILIPAAAEEGAAAVDLTTTGYSRTEAIALSDARTVPDFIDLESIFGNSFSALALAFWSEPDGATDPAEDDTFGLDLIGYRGLGKFNPPMLIASIIATGGVIGTSEVYGVTDGLWADTLVLSFSDWIGDIEVYDSTNNRIAWLVLDAVGMHDMYLWRHGVAAGVGVEAPKIGMAGFAF